MTQKELLYYEDAIKHEDNTIKIIDLSISQLEDKSIINFMKNERKSHEKMKSSLISMLKEKAHE